MAGGGSTGLVAVGRLASQKTELMYVAVPSRNGSVTRWNSTSIATKSARRSCCLGKADSSQRALRKVSLFFFVVCVEVEVVEDGCGKFGGKVRDSLAR